MTTQLVRPLQRIKEIRQKRKERGKSAPSPWKMAPSSGRNRPEPSWRRLGRCRRRWRAPAGTGPPADPDCSWSCAWWRRRPGCGTGTRRWVAPAAAPSASSGTRRCGRSRAARAETRRPVRRGTGRRSSAARCERPAAAKRKYVPIQCTS